MSGGGGFIRKIARIVRPSAVGDGPFVRNLSSSCQEFWRPHFSCPARFLEAPAGRSRWSLPMSLGAMRNPCHLESGSGTRAALLE
jgi:hypothetical protein